MKNFLKKFSLPIATFVLALLTIGGYAAATSITTINGSDTLNSTRAVLNANFAALNNGKMEKTSTSSETILSLPNLTGLRLDQGGTGFDSLANGYLPIGSGSSTAMSKISSSTLVSNNSGAITDLPNLNSAGGYTIDELLGASLSYTTVCHTNKCDYVATGTNDYAVINQAIQSIATSGTVYIKADKDYYIDPQYSSGKSILCKSNVDIVMEASTTLRAIANSSNPTAMIRCKDVDNVRIIGGVLIGERYEHSGDISSTSQQGFGISVLSSNNIEIRNIQIKDMWGDGIYITGTGDRATSSRDVLIDNVEISNCRRNGLSSIDWVSGTISNSIFKNTNGVNPKSGIDFEANTDDEMTKNIQVYGNKFLDNDGMGIQLNKGSFENFIFNNIASGNKKDGIMLTYDSNHNFISNNISTENGSASSTYYTNLTLEGSASRNRIFGNYLFSTTTPLTYDMILRNGSNKYNEISGNYAEYTKIKDYGTLTVQGFTSKLTFFDTADKFVNYENTTLGYDAYNTFVIEIGKGGTGDNNNFKVDANGRLFTFRPASEPIFDYDGASSASLKKVFNIQFRTDASSGIARNFISDFEINQSGTSSYAVATFNATETATGTGSHLLSVWQKNYQDLTAIDNRGYIGIGSTSPQYPLDIWGDMNLQTDGVYRIGGVQVMSAASSTALNTFYHTPSSVISLANNLSWSGNTIGVAANYSIPLTATTTDHESFYDTPSTRISAGTGLSWSGNTINSPWTYNGSNIYNNNSRGVCIGTTTTSQLFSVGNEYLVVASSTGYVGIGNNSPASALDIVGNVTMNTRNNNWLGISTEGLRFDGSGNYTSTINSKVGGAVLIDTDNTVSTERFFIGNNSQDPDLATHLFDVFENGNVSVGSTTARSKMDIYNGYVLQDGIYGEVYFNDATTSQAILTGATYQRLNAFNANGLSKNVTASSSEIIITVPGVYQVESSVSGTSQTNNVSFKTAIFLNGVEQNACHSERKYSIAHDVGNSSITCKINVTSANSVVDLRTRHDNAGTVNYELVYGNTNVNYIGEAQ